MSIASPASVGTGWRHLRKAPILLVLIAIFSTGGEVDRAGAQSINALVGAPRLTPPAPQPGSNRPIAISSGVQPGSRPGIGPGFGVGAGVSSNALPTVDRRPTVQVPRRLPERSAEPVDVGGAPNAACSSYRNFEGFAGRPCRSVRRLAAKSRHPGRPQTPVRSAKRQPSRVALAADTAVPDEIIIEIEGAVTEAQSIALAQRHRLTRVESQAFPLLGATMFRWRIPDGRSIDTVSRQLIASGNVKSAQPNYRFTLQQQNAGKEEGGSEAQYAAGKLHLQQAHALARGSDIKIAVIDSGVDLTHPELAGTIAGTFDALRSTEGAHTHGTGIAGAIVAHVRLTGSAPAARLLAIRSFGTTSSGAESTSFVVLKSFNYAVEQGAQIVNMSFAGPRDPLLARALTAAAARGIVLIAAAGNAGPKSPPLYPAADRNVIAVSATDAKDQLFKAASQGHHIALVAPGVDLLLPAPEEKYQVVSGTSFAAAYVSGLAALVLERNPGISPDMIRKILAETATDLGRKGADDQFGAGLADAWAAVQAARPVTAGPSVRAVGVSR